MKFVELFAGAGGLSLGLEAAGWDCVGHAEIEPHARAVLRHHWPTVPLWGDVAALTGAAIVAEVGEVDLLSGGSPCQDLSVAGKRKGLGGARSGLFHEQVRLWEEIADAQGRWPLLLWENVPGALSSAKGEDFGSVLGCLVGGDAVAVPDGGWRSGGRVRRDLSDGGVATVAWCVLDAQFFGVPQRRRRIFALACRDGRVEPEDVLALRGAGTAWERRAALLPVRESVRRDSEKGGKAREGLAAGTRGGAPGGGGALTYSTPAIGSVVRDAVASAITANTGAGGETQNPAYVLEPGLDPTRGVVGLDVAPTLMGRDYKGPRNFHDGQLQATVFPLGRPRRLLPVECERLMGWPDGHTATGTREDGTTYALSDTARYRLCGNGVASPCAAWIGQRLTPVPEGS